MRKKTNTIREARAEYKHFVDYPIVFEENEDGCWTVTCPILPGCISEGDNRKEAEINIKEAIRLYIRAVKEEIQLTKRKGADISTVAVGV